MTSQPAQSYPHALAPLQTGPARLRNRFVMGSMHTRLDMGPDPIATQAAFYAERARGEAALILTGGFSPNEAGLLEPGGPRLDDPAEAATLTPITEAVHGEGGLICAQILHSGRNARQKNCVGPSDIRSPINRHTPRALESGEIRETIEDFARAAKNACDAGFDGVEIMGSEGYLINQFTTLRCNNRTDEWGGSVENRHRLPVEIVRRVREVCGSNCLLIYRISSADLVEGGATGEEIASLAKAIEAAGADILNTGIGWHEARVPTIAYMVPRAAWRTAAARVKQAVSIPVIASNRINTPELAEDIIASGDADLVSMARPMLADPQFALKARQGKADDINTCIACNQACLDYIFSGHVATCLVNPRACRETEFHDNAAANPDRVAVIGGGAAGMACAAEAARLNHTVTLFEASERLGGQLNLARAAPGKVEFDQTLRYYSRQLDKHGVTLKLGTRPCAADLVGDFDRIVVATGVSPRIPTIRGIDHPSVATYAQILSGERTAGEAVVIIGAGGIGYDVAEYLINEHGRTPDKQAFFETWSVDPALASPGALTGDPLAEHPARRKVVMMQRKSTKPGAGLGTTTGWILRNSLRKAGVTTLAGVTYDRIDDAGVHVTVDGKPKVVAADTVILCAGQESQRTLHDELQAAGVSVSIIGGAKEAAELDALRAIDEGVRLAQAF